MSFNPLVGARVALGERVVVAGKFIAEYRRRRVGRKPQTPVVSDYSRRSAAIASITRWARRG